MNYTFELKSDYIELNKLLKFYGLVDSGAGAKQAITEGQVVVNNAVETRIRNKLVAGDTVSYNNTQIIIQVSQ